MDANRTLTVQVQRSGDKYTWELRRDGHFYPVKFSVPIYLSEEAARASGNDWEESFDSIGSQMDENDTGSLNRPTTTNFSSLLKNPDFSPLT